MWIEMTEDKRQKYFDEIKIARFKRLQKRLKNSNNI